MGACRALIILGVLVEHQLFQECSSSTHHPKGHKHSLFEEKPNREQVSKCKMDMKEIVHENVLLRKWGRAAHLLFQECSTSTHYFRRARRALIQRGTSTHHSENTQLENTCEYEKESQKNKLMKYSLEKWGAPRTYYFRRARRALIILGARRAPIILGGLDEHPFSRRARALTIQRTLIQRTDE